MLNFHQIRPNSNIKKDKSRTKQKVFVRHRGKSGVLRQSSLGSSCNMLVGRITISSQALLMMNRPSPLGGEMTPSCSKLKRTKSSCDSFCRAQCVSESFAPRWTMYTQSGLLLPRLRTSMGRSQRLTKHTRAIYLCPLAFPRVLT